MPEKTNLAMLFQFVRYFQWWSEILRVNEVKFSCEGFTFTGGCSKRLIIKFTALFSWIYSTIVVFRVYSIYVDPEMGGYIKNTVSVTLTVFVFLGQFVRNLIRKDSMLAAALCNTVIKYDIKEYDRINKGKDGYWKDLVIIRHANYYLQNFFSGSKTVISWYWSDIKNQNGPRFAVMTASASVMGLLFLPGIYLSLYPCSMHVYLRTTLSDCTKIGWIPALPANFFTKMMMIITDTYVLIGAFFTGVVYFGLFMFPLIISMVDHTSRILDMSKSNWRNVGSFSLGMKKYTQIRVIEGVFNQFHCGGLIMFLLVEMMFISISTEYVVIGLHSSLPPAILAVNAILVVDTSVVQVSIYQKAGDLNDISTRLLTQWKYERILARDKYLRRKSKAMQPLKARIGWSGNYFEKTTPFNLNQMSLEQAISLVLLSRTK